MDKELTTKQQTSEAVRQAESVLIITGQHPSVDQVASTIALSAILRKFGKKVTAVISDELPAGVKFLPSHLIEKKLGGLRDFIMQVDLSRAEVDKIKYTIEDGKLNVHVSPFAGGFDSKDVSFDYGDYHFDLVIVLGVASYSRIDKIYAQNAQVLSNVPLVNIDYHRSNEQYGAINLVEPAAASLSEILIALSESLQTGLVDDQIATSMLTGIISATDRFTAAHTTPKALTVAAQMMAMGADQQQVIRGLYRDNKPTRQNQPQERKETPKVQLVEQPKPAPQPTPVVQEKPAYQAPSIEAYMPAPAAPAVEPAPATPVVEAAPAPTPEPQKLSEPIMMEELLPPTHIEMSEPADEPYEAPEVHPSQISLADDPAVEPLVNDVNEVREQKQGERRKATNPANNPLFAMRLQ